MTAATPSHQHGHAMPSTCNAPDSPNEMPVSPHLPRVISRDRIPMRYPGLDLLRLLAVLMVLGRHFHFPDANFSPLLYLWYQGGWVGVDLFFVLSGFLVSGLLFREHLKFGKIDFRRFLIRRGLKIYPAFWVMLLSTIVFRLLRTVPIEPRYLFGELLFLQNYLGGLWNYTWSLAVEEHFYLGIAVLFIALLRKNRLDPFASIPTIFLILCVACLIFRILTVRHIPEYQGKWYTFATHNRIDSLFFGVLISYLWHYKTLRSRLQRIPPFVLLIAGLALLSPAFLVDLQTHKWVSAAGVMLFYLGSGLLVLAAVTAKFHPSRVLACSGTLGAASYSIYLWHGPVNEFCKSILSNATGPSYWLAYLPGYLGGSLFFGLLMSKLIEWPVLKVRDKFFPSESNSVSP